MKDDKTIHQYFDSFDLFYTFSGLITFYFKKSFIYFSSILIKLALKEEYFHHSILQGYQYYFG
jgi:hypothetical protein